jgi:hypothetical protein
MAVQYASHVYYEHCGREGTFAIDSRINPGGGGVEGGAVTGRT